MPRSADRQEILTIMHSFEPGGVERIALRLVAWWQAHGVDAPLYVGRMDGAMAAHFADRVALERAPATRLPTRHFETLWMIVQLARRLRRTSPRLLFAPGNSYAVVAVAMKLLLGRRCPPIVLKVSNDLVRPDMGPAMRFLYRRWLAVQGRYIDHFVAMSEPLAYQIARQAHVPPRRLHFIPNPSLEAAGQDAALQESRGRDAAGALSASAPSATDRAAPAGRRFCFVGRLVEQKDLALMLRAFAAGRRPDDTLTLMGDGPLRTALEHQAARLGIADAVRFMGHVPSAMDRLPDFDGLLLSSRYEGLPSAVVEALDAGLHVIATDSCCSMRALLEGGVLGDVVPIGDEHAFAAAIARAPARQRAPERAAAAARRHRIDHVAPLYLRLFARITASTASAPVAERPFVLSAKRDYAL